MNKLFLQKKNFLILTFLNLLVQCIITRYTMIKSSKEKKSIWFKVGLFLLQLAFIFIMLMPIPILLKFICFCIFSITFGITLASLNLNETLIQIAFYGTMSIFGIMAGLGVLLSMLNINLGPKIGIGLFYSLLGLILLGLFNIITGNELHKLFSILGILLFSIYILYDTNQIVQRDYKGDFIAASLDYYLDILNLLLNLFSFNQ